jgi:hypothetical protein
MRLLTCLLFVVLFAGCKQSSKIPDDFDYGKIENGVYKNAYFNYELPIPADWSVQNKEQVEQLKQLSQKMIGEKNKDLASQLKASEINYASLVTVFRHPVDSATGEFNPSFAMVAENIGKMPSIKNGEDYLRQAQKLMRESGLTYSFEPGFTSEKVGNRQFDRMNVIMTIRGMDIQQSYYATVDKKFALAIVLSYGNDEQKKMVEEAMSKLKFKE